MKRIALIMPYYDNPDMLSLHYETWASYSDRVRKNIEIVIVDDGTPTIAAAQVKKPDFLPSLKIFRVSVDLPWYQHAARNIGAHEARAKWLLLTDMDLLCPNDTMEAMLDKVEEHERRDGKLNTVFTFSRYEADTGKIKLHPATGKPHPHPNTFMMLKSFYWQVGGYDEDYCGIYGTDGLFRKRLWSVADHQHLPEKLYRYSREFLADASTRTLPRKEGREPGAKEAIDNRKREEGTFGKPKVLSMPYACAYKFDPFREPKA